MSKFILNTFLFYLMEKIKYLDSLRKTSSLFTITTQVNITQLPNSSLNIFEYLQQNLLKIYKIVN